MKKRLLSAAVAVCMLLSLLPAGVVALPVSAADAAKNITLGADGLLGGQQSSVYFGRYQQTSLGTTQPSGSEGVDWIKNGENAKNNMGPYYSIDPIKWRVLSNEDGQALLLNDRGVDVRKVHSDAGTTSWANSELRSWLNGYGSSSNEGGTNFSSGNNFIDKAFTEAEQAFIADTPLTNSSYDGPTVSSYSVSDKVFLLGVEDMLNTAYGFEQFPVASSTRTLSRSDYLVGGGSSLINPYGSYPTRSWTNGGDISEFYQVYRHNGEVEDEEDYALYIDNNVYIRPAITLDTSKILFTSAAKGGKDTATLGLKPNADLSTMPDNDGLKLTVRGNHYKNGISISLDTSLVKPGGTIEVTCRNTTAGDNEYISMMILSLEGEVLYYGPVAKAQSVDGYYKSHKFEVTLPADIAPGEYRVVSFSEQINGDGETDYASNFFYTKLTVEANEVTFDRNGGSTDADPLKMAAGAGLPAVNPTHSKYAFGGWYTKDGTGGEWGERFTADTEVTSDTTVYARWLPPVTFDVEGTEQTYQAGTAREITVTPSETAVQEDITVRYYEVSENRGALVSADPVAQAISAGTYLYVISLTTVRTDYAIKREFKVTDTAIPDFSQYDNVGYMYIREATAGALTPITFQNGAAEIYLTDGTYTNQLNNPNGGTPTYTSSNTNVATVAANGTVTAKTAGVVTITAALARENYTTVYASYTLTIRKKPVTITAQADTVTYGNAWDGNPGVTYSDELSAGDFDDSLQFKTDYTQGSGVGRYTITPYGLTSDKYDITFVPAVLTVEKRQISESDLLVSVEDKVYDGTETAVVHASIINKYNGDDVTVLVSGSFSNSSAGDNKDVYYTVTGLSGADSANYMLNVDDSTIKGAIKQAPVTVSAPAETNFVYDGTTKSVNVTAIANGGYFNDFKVLYNGKDEPPSAVGSYPVTVQITNTNYFLPETFSATLNITAAQQQFFSISGVGDTVTYGDPAFTLQADGVEGGAQVTYSLTAGDAVTVGTDGKVTITGVGTVTVTATSTLTNHSTRTATKTFTVQPKTLYATATATNKTYDGTRTVENVQISLGNGVVEDDTVTATYTSAEAVSADVENNKLVFVNGIALEGEDSGKYRLDSASVRTTVNIIPKEITAVSIAAEDKVYDGTVNAAYAVTSLTGVVTADASFVTAVGTAAFETAAAGTKKTVKMTITGLSGAKSGNYTLQTDTAMTTATIEKAEVTFTLGALSAVYDGTSKAVPVTATVGGAAFTAYNVTYTPSGGGAAVAEPIDAGSYTVNIELVDKSNYKTSYTSETLVIQEAQQSALTITGLIGTIDYGAKFSLTATGGSGTGKVTWATSDEGIATVGSENGAVEIVGTGSAVTITATKAKDENHSAEQTASVTFTPSKKAVAFVVTGLTHTYDSMPKSVNVAPSTGSDNYAISYTDTDGNLVSKPTNAGTYYVSVTATGHYDGFESATMTIRNGSISLDEKTFTVDDAVYGSEPTVTQPDAAAWPSGTTAAVTYVGSGIYAETTQMPTAAGSYTAILRISGANYDAAVMTDDFVIKKKDLTATPVSTQRAYGQPNPLFELKYDGFVNNDTPENAIALAPTMTTAATIASAPDTYDIIATGGSAANYNFIYQTGTLTILPAKDGSFYIYGGMSNPYVGSTFTLTAYYNNELPTVRWSSDDPTVATVDSATGLVEVVGDGKAVITAEMNDNRFDSNLRASFTLTATHAPETQQQIYFAVTTIEKNVTDPTFIQKAEGESEGAKVTYESVNSDVATVDIYTGAVTIKAAGTTVIRATAVRDHCQDVYAAYTLVVKKLPVTITAQADTVTYGEAWDGSTGVEYSDNLTAAAFDGTLSFTTNYTAGSRVGEYTITPTGLTSDTYDITFVPGILTVNPKALDVSGFTVEATDKTYDGTAAAQAAITKMPGVLEADTNLVSATGTAVYEDSNAGTHTVTYTVSGLTGAAAQNYTLSGSTVTTTERYKIAPMEITFAIGQTSFVYDGEDKELTVSASDENGRVFNGYSVSYTPATPNAAGAYTATVTLDDSTNYTTKQGDIPVTITEATQDQLAIAGLPGTIEYGDSFTLEAFGGVDGGDYTWSSNNADVTLDATDIYNPTVTIGDAVGKTVTLTVTKSSDNYKDVTAKVVFVPQAKSVTFELSNLEQTYGKVTAVTAEPDDSSATYSVTYNGGTTLPQDAGTYPVKVTATGNYRGSATAYLTINKAMPTGKISMNAVSYTYGDTPSAITSDVTDGAAAVITYAGTGIYTPQTAAPTAAGSYTAIAEISGANYETLTVTAEFTIKKAALDVWAKNASRGYGEPNPVFELEYSGFKNGEDAGVLLSEPVASTTANMASPVGTYDITVSGGRADNYTFNYVDVSNDNTKGKLTITSVASGNLYITGSANTAYVGDRFLLQAFYGNSKVDVTWSSNDTGVAEIAADGTVTAKAAGTVTITATADDNYGNATATFSLTVKQSELTLVPTGLVRVYNGQRQDISFAHNADFTPVLDGEGKNVEVTYTLISDPTVTEPIQAGTYSVTYTITDGSYTGGGNTTMYINKAAVQVKPADLTKEYGEQAPAYRLVFVNEADAAFASLDEITALTTFASDGAAATAPVTEGGYAITATLSRQETENLTLSIAGTGILTVTKAPLTISVKDVTREYGAENPALEAEYAGFKNAETADVLTGELALSYADTINAETAVGTYPEAATASGLTSGNYEITYVPGDVEVTKIAVTASAGTARRNYLTIRLDKPVEGLTAENFEVKNGEEAVTLTEVTASSDNQTYTLRGSFSTSVTYTVGIDLTGTAADATHTLTSEPLSIKPSTPSGGGGGSVGGGGGGVSTYTVTFDTQGGSEIDSLRVTRNGTVTEPAEPTREGYTFDGWYTDAECTAAYDFETKVTRNMTLYAKWVEDEEEPTTPTDPTTPSEPDKWENPFTDVAESDWFYGAVQYAHENGLFGGTSETTFAPDTAITRGMLVTVLWRAEGSPETALDYTFADVAAEEYYAKAVAWADDHGIVLGHSDDEFAPDDRITREQFAAILHRYAAFKGRTTDETDDLTRFTDADSVSDWAVENVRWAVGSGLITGHDTGALDPQGSTTRAEAAAILMRFLEK